MSAESVVLGTVAGWLLTYLVHSTLLIAAAEAVGRIVGSAALRDLLWKVAMLGALVTAGARIPAEVEIPSEWRISPASSLEAGASGIVAPATAAAAEPAALRVDPAWAALGLGLWLACALPLTALRLGGYLRLRLLLRERRRVRHGEALGEVDRLARRAGVAGVRLSTLEGLPTPIALGSREICLPPRALTELGVPERSGMLAHEMAHLRRRDPWWLLASHLVESVLWIQPLNRLVRHRLVEVSEEICDRRAAEETGDNLALARCLVEVAGWSAAGPVAPLVGLVSGAAALERRVDLLLAVPRVERVSAPERSAAALALLAAVGWLGPDVRVARVPDFAPASAAAASPNFPDVAWAERDRRHDPTPLFTAQEGVATSAATAFCWAVGPLPADPACQVRIEEPDGTELRLPAGELRRVAGGRFVVAGRRGTPPRELRVVAVEYQGERKTVFLRG